MAHFNSIIDTALSAIIYIAAIFILFYLGKLVYDLLHKKINVKEELVEKDNFAFALAQLGYYAGLLLAIGGPVIGPSHGLVNDLILIGLYGVLSIVLLNISIIINDKVLLRKFSVHKEIIEDQNAGTGIVEGANAFAMGMIILGSVFGEGGGIITALAFWAIGQTIMVLVSFVYDLITPYKIHVEIEKDNVAVGIGFAGALIAIANLIRYAIMHDFYGWTDSFISIGIDVTIGILFLPLVRFLTDKILLPGQKLTDEIVNQEKPNHGAALIEAFAYIGGSVLITWCI